jgi:hypothetical protein
MKKKAAVPVNEKKLRRKLAELTEQVRGFLAHLDKLMAQPSTEARGRQIAELSNRLNMYNDGIRYFWCNVDYRKDRPWTGELAEPFQGTRAIYGRREP